MKSNSTPASSTQIIAPILLGLAFGFLLQKGGAAKYHILMGSLLLQDFTVWKIMLSAILVGMIGLTLLEKNGLVESKTKPTKIGANLIGGLIFGLGFALIGYCPGTGAAALGQGNYDAIFGVIGLIAGSYLYAEISGWSQKTIEKWGDYGKLTISDVLKVSKQKAVVGMSILLTAILLILSQISAR